MNNKSKFALEIFITLFIATLLSSAISIIFGLIVMNLGRTANWLPYVNMLASCVWGLFVGYKINSLRQKHL